MNTPNEIWEDVVGFEGYYVVSNFGRLMRVYRGANGSPPGRMLTPTPDKLGYYKVMLSKNGRIFTVRVHRAVAEAFLGLPDDGQEVNHKDGDKSHNAVTNLEWVTRTENMRHSFYVLGRAMARGEHVGSSKLTTEDVLLIRKLLAEGISRRKIGGLFNVSNVAITKIAKGYTWKHVEQEKG